MSTWGDLGAAFIGAGFGAVVGPMVSQKLSNRAHVSARKEASYDHLVLTGRNLLHAVATLRYQRSEDKPAYWGDAYGRFSEAYSRTEPVRSKEIEPLADTFASEAHRVLGAEMDVASDDTDANRQGLATATAQATSAFEALREQVRRETQE